MKYPEGFFSNCPPALTVEQTNNYLEQMNNGVIGIENIVIEGNIRFVVHIIMNKYSKQNYINLNDLLSIGIIGLIKAVRNYKLGRNCSFQTYAYKLINNEILMEFRKNKKHSNNSSLDYVISVCDNNNIETNLKDVIVDSDDLEEMYEAKEEKDLIQLYIQQLDDDERIIIEKQFGFKCTPFTQQQIAEHLKISQAWVSRKSKKAREKIKSMYISNYRN